MITSILTREEAAARRREAAETEAINFQRKEGGSRLSFMEGLRSQNPRELGTQREVDFKANVLRAAPILERRNGMDMYHVTGHASVVDTPYEMWDFYGPYDEVVHRDAFDKTLASKPDVNFVVNHTGLTMARTIQPLPDKVPTLELEMGMLGEYNGLLTNAWLNPDPIKRPDVAMLMSGINDGLITEMSFKFAIVQGRWSEDFMTYVISEVDIHRGDVSAVNYGANPFTTIAARSREWMSMTRGMPRGAKIHMQELLAQELDILDFRETRQPMPVQFKRGSDGLMSLEEATARYLD